MTRISAFVTLLLSISICGNSRAGVMSRPPYVQCQSNAECMPGSCCTIGPDKFSIPKCKRMQAEDDTCRPGQDTTLNTTLTYPDGSQVELTNAHFIYCPCGYGLVCDTKDGKCRDPSQKPGFNSLLWDASIEED